MKKQIILLISAILILISCAGSFDENEMKTTTDEIGFKSDETIAAIAPEQAIQSNTPAKEEKIEKKIIKTAYVTIELKDLYKSRKLLDPLLKKHKAYISSEKQTNSDYELSSTILVRLESAHFDSLLNEICGLAHKVITKEIHTDDVTEEFIDITARLKNKKQVELQYLEILKKAYTIDDILNVNEHLRIIREEIEAKEGRLKYLENQVGFSTINLYMYEKTEQAYRGFGEKIIEGLQGGWKGIPGFIVALTYLWPVIIVVTAIIWIIIKRRKKKRQISVN